MKKERAFVMIKRRKLLFIGSLFLILFAGWTWLIQVVDVKGVGQAGTNIGFSTLNVWFHKLIGVHMSLYHITDWLGLIPLFVCMLFGCLGLVQWIKRKRILKVDFDILILGIYYLIVIGCYVIFEMIPLNYRPVLIDGFLETSYPSSTTLLVVCVMPTLKFQVNLRMKSVKVKKIISFLVVIFSLFMVIGRLISGVHWLTDIIGAILFSIGIFNLYKSIVFYKLEG